MDTTTDKHQALRLLVGLENGAMSTEDALVLAEALDPGALERTWVELPASEEVPEEVVHRSSELLLRPPEEDPEDVRSFLATSVELTVLEAHSDV